jgi:hypothetical protein
MAMLLRVNRVAMHHQALDHHQLSTGLSLMGRPMSRAKCPMSRAQCLINVQSPIQVPAYDGPPPQQQVYEHPYYPRQQQQPYFAPVYAMNYNAAHPSVSYGAARYATQPVYSQTHTYAHWGLGETEVEPPSYHLENHPPPPSHPPQPNYPPHPYYSADSDTFALFSDENPNGCHIM